MKKFIVFAAALALVGSAFAGVSSVGTSYIVVNNSWYNGSGTGNIELFGSNGQVGGDLGTLTALTLGGEATLGTTDWARDWAEGWSYNLMGYCVKDGDTKVIDDSYVSLTTTDIYDYSFKAQNYPGISVALNGLTDEKQYKLEVWFGGPDDKWDGGNNYVATFTKGAAPTPAVPEPATMSLLGLGALALALRRKLRK